MRVMRFKDESISDVLQVLAGILNLGNVTFITGNGAQVNEKYGRFWNMQLLHTVYKLC